MSDSVPGAVLFCCAAECDDSELLREPRTIDVLRHAKLEFGGKAILHLSKTLKQPFDIVSLIIDYHPGGVRHPEALDDTPDALVIFFVARSKAAQTKAIPTLEELENSRYPIEEELNFLLLRILRGDITLKFLSLDHDPCGEGVRC